MISIESFVVTPSTHIIYLLRVTEEASFTQQHDPARQLEISSTPVPGWSMRPVTRVLIFVPQPHTQATTGPVGLVSSS